MKSSWHAIYSVPLTITRHCSLKSTGILFPVYWRVHFWHSCCATQECFELIHVPSLEFSKWLLSKCFPCLTSVLILIVVGAGATWWWTGIKLKFPIISLYVVEIMELVMNCSMLFLLCILQWTEECSEGLEWRLKLMTSDIKCTEIPLDMWSIVHRSDREVHNYHWSVGFGGELREKMQVYL